MFGIDDIANAVGVVGKIIDKFIPDPAAALAAKQELARMDHDELKDLIASETAVNVAQAETNKEEARSTNLFVAGWRPFIGWTCGAAFALNFVLLPLLNFTLGVFGRPQVFIALDMATLLSVTFGMLGLGGLRTYEKVKGFAEGRK